jgi:hypothetical protein
MINFKSQMILVIYYILFFLSSCQILKILDEKENFPILKNAREISTLINSDKKFLHPHSYDNEVEKESNELESEQHYFTNFINDDNINFINLFQKEKKKLKHIEKKENFLENENKKEQKFIDKEFNKFLLKIPEIKESPANINSKYLKDYQSKREYEKLGLNFINNNINLFKKDLDDFSNNSQLDLQKLKNLKFVTKMKIKKEMKGHGYANFSNIITKEIETKNIRISSIEDYFHIKEKSHDNSDIFNGIIALNKIDNIYFKNCGENFKLCFVSNEELIEKEQEMVIYLYFLKIIIISIQLTFCRI